MLKQTGLDWEGSAFWGGVDTLDASNGQNGRTAREYWASLIDWPPRRETTPAASSGRHKDR
jgi:hypothetical protein